MTTNNAVCAKPEASAVNPVKEPSRPVYEPRADVVERPDAIHILLDMPGVDQKGLEVTIDEHVLRIRGKAAAVEQKPESVVHREFELADYERSLRLGSDLDEARTSATLKNGQLRIVIPKSEAAKPRQISVKAE